jgi:hypothetical protein
MIPMCIDRTLLRGVTVGLEEALFDGLAINGPGGYERCRKLLSEPADVVERRSELEKRRQRLLLARKELTELFVRMIRRSRSALCCVSVSSLSMNVNALFRLEFLELSPVDNDIRSHPQYHVVPAVECGFSFSTFVRIQQKAQTFVAADDA